MIILKLMSFQISGEPETVLTTKALDTVFGDLVASDGDLRYGDGVGLAAVRSEDSKLTASGHGGLRRAGFVASYELTGQPEPE
jgi:hypothetical protein